VYITFLTTKDVLFFTFWISYFLYDGCLGSP